MKVRVCFHDKCFDGASSAAIFTRFYKERINPAAEFFYTGMTHKASQPFEDGMRSPPGQGSRFTIELPGNMNSYVANSNC